MLQKIMNVPCEVTLWGLLVWQACDHSSELLDLGLTAGVHQPGDSACLEMDESQNW